MKPVDLVDLSHHHQIVSALVAANSRLETVFPSVRENTRAESKNLIPNQHILHEVTLSPKLVPVVVATSLTIATNGAAPYQTSKHVNSTRSADGFD